MRRIIHSRLIRWIWVSGLCFLLLLTLLRVVFHLVFKPAGETGVSSAFIMGLRYDARLVGVFLFIILLLASVSILKPYHNNISRKIFFSFTGLFSLLIIVFYTVDFAHYAYLRQRLNGSALSYLDDAKISSTMVWQTYPVLKIIAAWIVSSAALVYLNIFLYRTFNSLHHTLSRKNIIGSYVITFLVLAVAIFGRVGQFPLRWSDAYRMGSDYKANLSLNPFQSFFSSLKFRHSGYDEKLARKYYPLLASGLGMNDADSSRLNFRRINPVNNSIAVKQPNVVLVICESFSAYKSSMWGNPLNTTPYFNELCNKGIFFNNCFSPAYGTARGVWAIMTGIPDVTDVKTASRNPALADQQCIMNEFDAYSKYYFIGGSASWANIRGLLTGNIKDLHLYEQEDYKASTIDVWGISDKNLFLEANKVLKEQKDPFFAIIQTADNHRPYTIPKEDRPFIKFREFPKDTLAKYGFWSNQELNAFAYMDYTYKVFFEAAQKEKYFDNTIFVFVGDHGIRGDAGNMFPRVWTDQGLTCQHVPLLFYAPGFLPAQKITRKVSQIDIMPSIASLCGIPVTNTGLGENFFATDSLKMRATWPGYAFILDMDRNAIGLAGEEYYYDYNLKTKNDGFYSLQNNLPLQPGEPDSTLKNRMRHLTQAYYETSRYLLFNNKKIK